MGLYSSCIKAVKNMEKKSILMTLRGHVDTTLILFELILSVIFVTMGYIAGNIYFRGVGVGLIIAWVTSAIAYLYKKKVKS